MPSPLEAVTTYFHAKDENRPFLMGQAFAEDIRLEMIVKTEAISFPSSANGLAEVEEVLVRRIATDFENVYTFGLARPTEPIDVTSLVIGWSPCRPGTEVRSGSGADVTTGISRPTRRASSRS